MKVLKIVWEEADVFQIRVNKIKNSLREIEEKLSKTDPKDPRDRDKRVELYLEANTTLYWLVSALEDQVRDLTPSQEKKEDFFDRCPNKKRERGWR